MEFFSWLSNCLARIFAFNRFFFLSMDTNLEELLATKSMASFVILCKVFSSIGCEECRALFTNCSGVCHVPTRISPVVVCV